MQADVNPGHSCAEHAHAERETQHCRIEGRRASAPETAQQCEREKGNRKKIKRRKTENGKCADQKGNTEFRADSIQMLQ